jgi:uncharacterized protein YndB with AHSA1/START domain
MVPEHTARVERHMEAAAERVFAAFADARLLPAWLTPSPEITMDVLELDFRVGGRYRFAYNVPGAPTMHVNGIYADIDPPGRLIFSWNIEPPDEHAGVQSEVTVTIAPLERGSLLRIDHRKLDAAGAARRHSEGWEGAIGRLVQLCHSEVPR